MVLAVIVSAVLSPIWKAIMVTRAINKPSKTTSKLNALSSIGESAPLGFSCIILGLCGSKPIAIAGRLSVTRFIKSKCTGAKGTGSAHIEA
ncbi:hypothetical protein SDC9_119489 [bioreactor metagenome]|uniref:Uncharacterized protein n=1 Tax=bioreactor metagenome TaxID=1076179 RepID=A0A645C8R2_9ZZZZ